MLVKMRHIEYKEVLLEHGLIPLELNAKDGLNRLMILVKW